MLIGLEDQRAQVGLARDRGAGVLQNAGDAEGRSSHGLAPGKAIPRFEAVYFGKLHTRIMESAHAEMAYRPSGVTTRDVTAPGWGNRCSCVPEAMSQTRTVLSSPPDIIVLPSGVHAIARMVPEC